MPEPKIIAFEEAIKATDGKDRGLLIGNGFSMTHFRYGTLLEKSGLDAKSPLRALFKALNTVDFEVVIKALEDAAIVESAYQQNKRAAFFVSEADKLRRVLVHAIRQIHPAHRTDIQDVIPKCMEFLSRFAAIFTLNYDLLLYWVILEDGKKFRDGFGLGRESNGFLGPFQEGAYCNVYNLHGGLHLFPTSDDGVEKRLMGSNGVIDAIAETITRDKRLPLYIAEGTSIRKLSRIYAVPYLRYCYGELCDSSGTFFVFGHSVGANDAHVYDALFKSKIDHLYFCIHRPTADLAEIDGELSRYKKRNGSSVDYSFVDSETAHVWA
jgi:Domain of unknown function (DUF4917)